jgi:malate dehydrogenase (oxaloacetate-decarboxylating)(NADP+)
MASVYPEPEDKKEFIKAQLYDYNYDETSSLPPRYSWPKSTQEPFTNP